ncbi:MAG: hypothetical protein HZB26_12145 [Candidatus Hydrogenedentes bacterium]|nr:hypothetical protein [Candidatus Hydrogenedentota bacterium]
MREGASLCNSYGCARAVAPDLGIRYLRNEQADAEDRILAAELAGDYVVVDDEIVDALLAILCNGAESELLRSRAAISFGPALETAATGDFDDPDDVPITEPAFQRVQQALTHLYLDATLPKIVRRRILEVSVRARQDWNEAAIRAAYTSGDPEWMLTAVFCMGYVRGFDREILESLNNADPEIHSQAVGAAGAWRLDAAWPHISRLLTSGKSEKPLLLAAIEAAASIRPKEAVELLDDYMDSDDEDIADAVESVMAMSEDSWADLDDDDK